MATRRRRRDGGIDVRRRETIFREKKPNMNALEVGVSRNLTLQPEREVYAHGVRIRRCTRTFVFAHAYICVPTPSHRALIMVKADGAVRYIRHPGCLALLIIEI